MMLEVGFRQDYERFFAEDDLHGNAFYLKSLSTELVECHLKIKRDVLLSGLPFFIGAFNFLGSTLKEEDFLKNEGKQFKKGEEIVFKLPFSIALTGERVALNLLQQSTKISTFTKAFLDKTKDSQIALLDTRKTTPGLRQLEKYAVRMAGAYNHRFSQADAWMIKDNHKNFYGGLKPAWEHFLSMKTFYQTIIVEIHSLNELQEAIDLGINHIMLDNFTQEDLKQAVLMKLPNMTYEISGGVKLENIESFIIPGVDAISIGALTHSAPHVDLSMKIKRISL